MKNIFAIFKKQIKDTFRNKTVFIQFVLFPLLAAIMHHSVKIEGMPENFFIDLFATMYIGMAPLTSMAAIISEEKEKNTLRVLMMSNVKPWEYLLGTGIYTWLVCMLGTLAFCITGNYPFPSSAAFLGVMAAGIFTSLLIGAAIGTWSQTQMIATSLTVPVMMVFSFLPMLSMFNGTIAKIAKFTYSEQIHLMLQQIGYAAFPPEGAAVVCINILAAAGLFLIAYRRCGLA